MKPATGLYLTTYINLISNVVSHHHYKDSSAAVVDVEATSTHIGTELH